MANRPGEGKSPTTGSSSLATAIKSLEPGETTSVDFKLDKEAERHSWQNEGRDIVSVEFSWLVILGK